MRMLFAALLEFDISQMRSPATSVLLPLSGEKRKSIRQGQTDAIDESPEGLSPSGAPRTVREPLDSYGSRCSAVAVA
jgi:hypothetical protein